MEKITIVNIERKAQPSKFKPGTTYLVTYVTDQNSRRLSASGNWALAWAIGQTIDVDVETGTYQAQDGSTQPSYRIKSPPRPQFQDGPRKAPWETAYSLALSVLVKELPSDAYFTQRFLDKLDSYAEHLKNRVENGPASKLPPLSTPKMTQPPIPGLEDLG